MKIFFKRMRRSSLQNYYKQNTSRWRSKPRTDALNLPDKSIAMKQLTAVLSFILVANITMAQQGYVPVNEMLGMSKSSASKVMDQLVKTYGFAIAEVDVPQETVDPGTDTTIYFTWGADKPETANNIMFTVERNAEKQSGILSFTTPDSSWYAGEIKKIPEMGFAELDNVKVTTIDAQDVHIYELNGQRIKILSSFMGTQTKFYIIDVIWFGE